MTLRHLLVLSLFSLFSISNCESISDRELREKGYKHVSQTRIEYTNGDYAEAHDLNGDGIIDRIDYYKRERGQDPIVSVWFREQIKRGSARFAELEEKIAGDVLAGSLALK